MVVAACLSAFPTSSRYNFTLCNKHELRGKPNQNAAEQQQATRPAATPTQSLRTFPDPCPLFLGVWPALPGDLRRPWGIVRKGCVSIRHRCGIDMPIDEVLARLSHPGHGRPSRFHKRLLWITGFTQLGDAQALLVMMFLETQIPCAFPHVTVVDVNALTTAGT
jgi:hypothetical protein